MSILHFQTRCCFQVGCVLSDHLSQKVSPMKVKIDENNQTDIQRDQNNEHM